MNGYYKIYLIIILLVKQFYNFRRILLDTGDENIPQYLENLKTVLGNENATIRKILLTHWHHDHI